MTAPAHEPRLFAPGPPPRHLLVVDLEATCDERGALPREEMEILEIGAVLVAPAPGFATLGEFGALVRPARHPRLSAFCSRLTGITQAQVDAARPLAEALADLGAWLRPFEELAWGSWGDYDRRQWAQDLARQARPDPLPARHLNLKHLYAAATRSFRNLGLGRALARAGLEFQGRPHRGLDDARNVVRLLQLASGVGRGSGRP
ncbi:MAG TPA: 3'-5' exonuclease [Myxococcota bacterium]|nr:3'-5' exonuclease [Myxococcota bacterium]HRY94549.1 3'-5' exonuclease [Myxococcota bacterium]HSA22386.1 3'-5' exonuclease [Myxococcota bacterium]